MTLNNPTEYFGATEYLKRLRSSLELGRSYMKGDDWELFSTAIQRQIQELTDATCEYKINWDLHQLAQHFFRIELKVEGTFLIPSQSSITWGTLVATSQRSPLAVGAAAASGSIAIAV